MPVTLAQAKLNTQDDLDAMVIDEFRKTSAILDTLLFHDAVNPMGGGSTLTYGYHRVVTQRAAAFRAINSEYTPSQAEKQRFTTDLKPLGGAFEIDRVLAQVARGGEVTFQMQQLIKATTTKFQDEVINGDTAVDTDGFDGLDKALAGTDTEFRAGTTTDWTDLDSYGTQKALDDIDEFLMLLDGEPAALIGNSAIIGKLSAIARRANQYVTRPVNGLTGPAGQPLVRRFFGDNTLLIDAGEKAGSTERIIPVYDPDNAVFTLTISGSPTGGDFTLTVVKNPGMPDEDSQETAAIAFDADAATIEAALEALSNVDTGVAVTGSGPFTITFAGNEAEADVDMDADGSGLTGGTDPDAAVVETADVGGVTDLYAVRIGLDGFHGVSVTGQDMVQTWLPDFDTAGAVKKGEVEMGPVTVALKATKAAAVFRRIKVR